MALVILDNIGSGNDLLPDGTKPLPEPIIFLRFYQNSPGTNELMGPKNFTPAEHFIFQVQFPTCQSRYGQSCMHTEPEIWHLCVSKFSVAKQFYAHYIFIFSQSFGGHGRYRTTWHYSKWPQNYKKIQGLSRA